MGTAWWGEDAGDLGDGFAAGPGVPHGGARVAVSGLGHDELERDLGVAEVGGGEVAELVEVEPGIFLEEDAGAVVAGAGPAGVRADVLGAGAAGGDGLALLALPDAPGPETGRGGVLLPNVTPALK